MEIRVMIEKVGQPDPVRAEVAGKTAVASDGEGGSLPKESVKKEVVDKAAYVLKQPKDESQFEQVVSGSGCSMIMKNSKPAISDFRNSHHAVPDTPKLPESNDYVLPSSKLDKTEVRIEGGDDKSAGNPNHYFIPLLMGSCIAWIACPMLLKIHEVNHLRILRMVQVLLLCQKYQDVKKESEINHQGCDEMTEATFSTANENKQHGQNVEESAKSPTAQKVASELSHGSINVDGTMRGQAQNWSWCTKVGSRCWKSLLSFIHNCRTKIILFWYLQVTKQYDVFNILRKGYSSN